MKTPILILALFGVVILQAQTPTPTPAITYSHTLEWANPKEAAEKVTTYEVFEALTPPKLVATVSAPTKVATYTMGPGVHTYYVIAKTATRQSAPSANHVVSDVPSAPVDLKTKTIVTVTVQTP